jgi:hypothetical protein
MACFTLSAPVGRRCLGHAPDEVIGRRFLGKPFTVEDLAVKLRAELDG